MHKNTIYLIFSILSLLFFAACERDKSGGAVHDERLVGSWNYIATQEKKEGQWVCLPSQSVGAITYQADGNAVITMTYDGQSHSKAFRWELRSNGDYIIDGTVRGKLVFEGRDRFYLCTDETFDPEVGGNVSGEFRDIYDRRAPLEDQTVITNPEGRHETYSQSSRLAYDNSGDFFWSYAQKSDIVWGADSDVYFLNLVPHSRLPNDYYIKGVVCGSQIRVSFPQIVSASGKSNKYLWIMEYDSSEKTFVPQELHGDVIFNIEDDGTLSMADSGVILAFGSMDGEWLGPLIEQGYSSAVTEIAYRPANTHLITPPAGLEIQKWWMKSTMPSGVDHDVNVNVAIGDGEFYIQGISVQYPDAWIKGVVGGSEGQRFVSFAQQQFMGCQESHNELGYFYGYTYTGRWDESEHQYIQDNRRLFAAETPVVLHFDAEGRTLTAEEGQGFTVNNGIGVQNMWESFGYLSFSYNGTVFKTDVPWDGTEISMTFKAIDEDSRLCQVGNGNIPAYPDDLRGQAIDDFYTGEIAVPEYAAGYKVVRVGRGAFEQMPKITSVVLPDCVEQIDEHAFFQDKALTHFRFPSSLKIIKDAAFMSSGISAIALGNVTELGVGVFSSCDNLTEVRWPGHLTVIPESTFEECRNLTKVVVDNGVVSIDKYAFAFCYGLSEIDLSAVTTLEKIGKLCFKLTSLRSLVLPKNLRSVGSYAFQVMNDLTSFTVLGATPPVIEKNSDGSGAFSSINENCVLYVPKGCVRSYSEAYGWNEFLRLGGIEEIDS